MALTIVSAGSSSLLSDADYQAELARVNALALDPNKIFPVDFENDEIPQGTILNVGGILMKAVAAESISGTASLYVKVDHTTRLASYVATLTGVTWNSAYNGYYDVSGDLYLFDEATAFFDEVITDRHLIYSQLRKQIFEELGATKPNWTTIILILQAAGIVGVGTPALAFLVDNYIVMYDSGNEDLQSYRFPTNSPQYTAYGSALNIVGAGVCTITRLSDDTIALFSVGIGELRTYTYSGGSGGTWALTGSGLAIAGAGNAAITALNATDIAFIDTTNEELRTYRFNGSTWAMVGSALSIPGIGNPAMTTLNSTDVVLLDSSTEYLRRYTWNSSNWAQVGNDCAADADGWPAITAMNNTDVLVVDSLVQLAKVFRWNTDGEIFELASIPADFSGAGNPAVTAISTSEFAYIDSTNDDLCRYHILNEPKVF